MEAPSGTVTFLFTDVEGSTRLWEAVPEAMRLALARHDELLRAAIEAHGGRVFSTGGDGFAVAFQRAGDASRAAVDAQAALAVEEWPEGAPIRVRMGLHTGEAEERGGDYFGPDVNRASRLMGVAHGGQVVCSSVTAELLRGVELTDLGEHRLRDLSGSQRVVQVGRGAFPPLRAIDAFPSNLPAQLGVFVGRGDEIDEVRDALALSRVVTLTGVGGVGKTRLAVQAAAELLPGFRDGAWLVELAPLVEAGELSQFVARSLGIPHREGESLEASIWEFLRSRQLLVVLDNCEHVLDPVTAFVTDISTTCAQVSVLATSREGLRVRGERVVAVGSLGLPSAGVDASTVAAADAVRLFVERAKEARRGFELTDTNIEAVARLTRRLDGIPLAIELAAARVSALTPSELADRLDERFRLLSGPRSMVERHQTLQRAIDWSYDLLTEPEQTALNRTAVFAGDFGLDAAEEVVAGGEIDAFDVVELLSHLVDKSLVIAEDRGGQSRYRLLETIRQYAEARLLAGGEAESVRRAHAEHCRSFAYSAGVGLQGPDEALWAERIDAELANLSAAVAWAVSASEVGVALDIAAALNTVRGVVLATVAGSWAALIVAAPGAPGHPRYAEALSLTAFNEQNAGRYDSALVLLREALAAAEASDLPPVSHGRLLRNAYVLFLQQGLGAEAAGVVGRWLPVARAAGDEADLVLALGCAGIAAAHAGNRVEALQRGSEAMAVARRIANPSALAYAALQLGTLRITSDPDEARALFAEGAEGAHKVGNGFAEAHNLNHEGWIFAQQGDWHQAAVMTQRGLALLWKNGIIVAFRGWLRQATLVLAALDDPEGAATLHGVTSGRVQLPFGLIEPAWADSEPSVRRRLGAAAFNDCVAKGAAMTIDEVAAFVDDRLSAFAEGSSG